MRRSLIGPIEAVGRSVMPAKAGLIEAVGSPIPAARLIDEGR